MTWLICYFTDLLLYWTVTLLICYFTEFLAFFKVRNSEVSHPNFLWLWYSKIIHYFGRTNGLVSKINNRNMWTKFLSAIAPKVTPSPPSSLASFQIPEQPPGGGYLYRTTLVFRPGSRSTISDVNEATEVQWHPHPILPKSFCMIKHYKNTQPENRYTVTYTEIRFMPLTKNPIQTETKYLAPTNPCHDWLNRLQLKRTGLVGEVVFDLIILHIGNRLLLKTCPSSTQIVVPDVFFLYIYI